MSSPPTGFGDRICVGCTDQTVHAFEARSGKRAWRWKGPHESWNSGVSVRPILHDDRLFVFAMSGELYVLDTTTAVDRLAPLYDRPAHDSTALPQPWALVSITGGADADAAVCSSGYGDGEYAVRYGMDAEDRLVRIRLCFIPPDGVRE